MAFRFVVPGLALVAALAPLACGSDDGGDAANGGAGGVGAGGTAAGGGGAGAGGAGGADGGGAGGCSAQSPAGLGACADQARYEADVKLITGERDPGSTHWQVVQDRCADVLKSSGFSVEKHDYGTGVNVIGTRAGKTKPEERVLVGAHYDHLKGCPGADDNATGTSAVLEIARVLGTADFARTLVLTCFDEEEDGLLGSKAYAQRALINGEKLVGVTVFDMIGFVDDAPGSQSMPGGFDAVFPKQIAEVTNNQSRANFLFMAHDAASAAHGTLFESALEKSGRMGVRVEVPPALMTISDLRRSDHAPFWDAGFPALFAGDTAEFRYPAYHCKNGDDVIANLSFEFAMQVVRAATLAVATQLEVVGAGGSSGGGGGGGGGGSGTGGSGGGSGTGGSGGGSGVDTCAKVCALIPLATTAQGQCLSDAV
ncbi:MAG: M28 family peptidase, partial [Myxococcales bacterium]|nr:M28 family peptidase [Myxococcales bacterium]